jgi:TolB-like protein/DNA-binding winged helix-turn-helix (wHTH) protein/Flp pilus assembly protein TadD
METANPRGVLRFADFELDVAGYELRGSGRPIRLERQPMDLLIMLVERRGQLVSREDIVARLWGKDVFVDVDTGVHTAVRKIRRALRDAPERPAFVETVPGRGYRFIAPVQVVGAVTDAAPAPTPDVPERPRQAGTRSVAVEPRLDLAKHRRIGIGLLTAAIVVSAIAWGLVGRGGAPVRSTIAVLPFENLGGDPDRAYLADGLTEEVTAWLGQADPERLRVVSRTSAVVARRASRSLADIGRELGADYILESSIRIQSGRARITAALIRARDQVQVWSEVYTRELTSMLGLQQELGVAIAEQIRFRLAPQRVDALARREPRVAAAYDAYLRGLTFANQRTPATTQKALEDYERATSLDPDYALAWSALALTRSAGAINSDAAPLDVIPRVREAARRAVRANPDLAEAHHALGYLDWLLEWDWPAAEREFRRAVDLDPRYPWALMSLGHLLSQSGRHSEALAAMRRTRELDPQNAMTYAISSQVAFQAREHQAALDHASQAIALDGELWIGYMMRGQAYEQSGRPELALDALAVAARFSGGNSKPVSLSGYILARTGRRDQAREVLAGLDRLSRERYVPPYAQALVHAGLGQQDAVFDSLERAFDVRDVHLIYLPVDPKWDPYRSDPRFEALLARCGFPSVVRPSPPPS